MRGLPGTPGDLPKRRPARGSEAQIKQRNRWDHLGSASENVDVNMNVYVYVNVSADRPPGSNKARNCRDHLRYFRVSGSRRATVSRLLLTVC